MDVPATSCESANVLLVIRRVRCFRALSGRCTPAMFVDFLAISFVPHTCQRRHTRSCAGDQAMIAN